MELTRATKQAGCPSACGRCPCTNPCSSRRFTPSRCYSIQFQCVHNVCVIVWVWRVVGTEGEKGPTHLIMSLGANAISRLALAQGGQGHVGELDNLLLANLISAPLLPLRLSGFARKKGGFFEAEEEVVEVDERGMEGGGATG